MGIGGTDSLEVGITWDFEIFGNFNFELSLRFTLPISIIHKFSKRWPVEFSVLWESVFFDQIGDSLRKIVLDNLQLSS